MHTLPLPIHRLLTLCLALLAGPTGAAPTGTADPELVRLTDQVMTAIAARDRTGVGQLLATDFVLINRDGRGYGRDTLLDAMVPLPAGRELSYQQLEPHSLVRGEMAFHSFITDERLRIHGQVLDTQFRSHYVYIREDGHWKLAAFAYHEIPVDPPRGSASSADLARVAGSYRLGDTTATLTVQDGRLMRATENSTATELVPIEGLRFFLPGVEGEIVFTTDGHGAITGYDFVRNWRALRWTRVH